MVYSAAAPAAVGCCWYNNASESKGEEMMTRSILQLDPTYGLV